MTRDNNISSLSPVIDVIDGIGQHPSSSLTFSGATVLYIQMVYLDGHIAMEHALAY